MVIRRFLACLFLVLGFSAANAQTYTVLHATGRCKLIDSGAPIEAGQVLKATDMIDLGNRYGHIVVWGGPLNLKSLRAVEKPGNNWKIAGTILDLKAAPIVAKPEAYKEHFGSMTDLIAHFDGRRYLLLDKSWLIADPGFRLKGDTVLFYKFESPLANIQVNRKVEHRHDSLLLEPKFILDMNGKPVPPDDATNFELYWLDLKTKGYKKMARFNFIFVDEKVLLDEVGRLVKLVQSADKEADVRKEVTRFLIETYGVPDPHNFQKWMGQHFPQVK
ncbi:MAG: hypothetical protein U0176_26010 [Bacteroidia bacterium]